ncbi:hypothetical protein Naga_100004g125 [Nannochloropsis gaditana]|uniref:Uncharacterized protein n=1 Tax=Nannochloropsis gaditana TaxID=72520 RepID=W7TMD4_9STRA|nr:hypothetical protein Naga_100004g125 [Nannochloropsis gaditana]
MAELKNMLLSDVHQTRLAVLNIATAIFASLVGGEAESDVSPSKEEPHHGDDRHYFYALQTAKSTPSEGSSITLPQEKASFGDQSAVYVAESTEKGVGAVLPPRTQTMSSDLPMLIVSDMLGQRPQSNEAGKRDFSMGRTSKEVLARRLVNRKEDESPFKKISTQENYTLEGSSRMGSRKRRIKTGSISDCPPQMDFHTTAIKCIIM